MRYSLLASPIAVSLLAGTPVTAVQAQSGISCRTDAIENAPDTGTLVAIGRQCLVEGRSNGMQTVASMIEYGFGDEEPNWRLAAQLNLELADHTEKLPYTSLGARVWEGALTHLAYKFLHGDADTGWPQDFELALKFQTRIIDRLKREQDTQEPLSFRNKELGEINEALARSKALTSTFYGDLEALSVSNPYHKGWPLRLSMPERGRFTLVVNYVDKDEYREPEEDPRYGLTVEVYSRDLLSPRYAGVCLVLANADVPADSKPKVGIWFEHFGKQPFRQTSGEFAGQYRLSQDSNWGLAGLEWPISTAPRSVRYEFRPLNDRRLCLASM